MKTTIYYFSGTGNSLIAARKVGSILGDTDLVPIASLRDHTGDITAPEGNVGIVSPVYDSGIPVIVRNFLGRLNVSPESYLFGIVTLGGTGGSALKMINADLRAKSGRTLNAGFLVKMPGNFPPVGHLPSGAKKDAILAAADQKIERIGGIIRDGIDQPVGIYPLSSLIQAMLYGGFSKSVHAMDEKFSVSDTCTSCGICASVCPVGNITMNEGKPVFHHRCELCCACLNFCPPQAIDLHMLFGSKGRGRYHHPGVAVSDMEDQKEYPL